MRTSFPLAESVLYVSIHLYVQHVHLRYQSIIATLPLIPPILCIPSVPRPPRTAHSTLVKEQYLATENLARRPTDCDINHTVPEPHQRQHERRGVVEAKVLRVAVDEGVDSINGRGNLSKHINIA